MESKRWERWQGLGELGHPHRQVGFPEPAVLPAARRGPPAGTEVGEGTDERRPVPTWRARDLSFEELAQADRVADQRYPLRGPISCSTGQLLGLSQGQHRLAAARPTPDLDPVQKPSHLEQHGLLRGQPVRLTFPLLRLPGRVERREVAP